MLQLAHYSSYRIAYTRWIGALSSEVIADDHSTWTMKDTIVSKLIYACHQLSTLHFNVVSGEGAYDIPIPSTEIKAVAKYTVYDGCHRKKGCSKESR
jgi:hypothetical protein